MGNSLADVSLRNLIVEFESELVGAQNGQLSEGAIAQLTGNADANLTWRFTKNPPNGTLTGGFGVGWIQTQRGFWVATPMLIPDVTLGAGGTVTLPNLFLSTELSTGTSSVHVVITHKTPGGTPGFIKGFSFPTENSLKIDSSSASDTSVISVVIYPNISSLQP